MTSNQLLELLKREIAASKQENEEGRTPSLLGALELIQSFKKQIQDETIKDFLTVYSRWVPDHDARQITADKISREYENPKHSLVKCK